MHRLRQPNSICPRAHFFIFLWRWLFDTTPFKLQLKFANIAEKWETKPRYHVRRISFSVTVILTDEVVNYSKPLSVEDQEVLNWQARTEDLQEPLAVRKELIHLSERLCPHKQISLSFVDFVSDEDTQQQWTGTRPLSEYRHVSFRRVMLTKHSAVAGQPDGQPELLALHDGLGGDQSGLRWRSHDFMKLRLRERKPSYKVFWLSQWDIVELANRVGSPNDATNVQWGRWGSPFPQVAMMRPGTGSEKFHGIRHRGERKSPWIAEMRKHGQRRKIDLGGYKIPEAAARAADAGYHYYNFPDKLNFRDSPQLLRQIPRGLSDKDKEKLVKVEAKRLAALAETLPSTWYPANRSNNISTEGFASSQPWDTGNGNNHSADDMQPATPANFVDSAISDDVALLMDSVRGSETNLDAQPSTSYGGELSWRGTGGSSPEAAFLWLLPSTSGWDANLVPDISGDMIAGESPGEILAEDIDISGHWAL